MGKHFWSELLRVSSITIFFLCVGGNSLIIEGFVHAKFHLIISHPKILVKQLKEFTG